MGRFDEYLKGTLEIEVGGEKLELNAVLEDKRKLKSCIGKKLDEEQLKVIDDVIINILKRSYPEENEQALINLYTKNDTKFLDELLVAFGWVTREDLKKKVKKEEAKVMEV